MAGIKIDGMVPCIPFDQPSACPPVVEDARRSWNLGFSGRSSSGRPARQRDLGPARERCVLAILLLTPRTIVPAETLIDRLWDTRPPAKARESLSAYLARLRASLRQAVGDDVQLAGRARGYVLDVDPEAVDLHQFRRLRRQADALAASGDHDQAATLLREADGLWRGPALAGIDGDWVARMRDSLEEERRAALLERVECELALGRHADLVGELHHLLAQYPLDETFIAHQMTALYRSGRPGDALSLYRETRSRLVEEQGTEPGRCCPNYISGSSGAIPGLPASRPPGRRPGYRARISSRPGCCARTPCRPRRPISWGGTRNSACSSGSRATPPGSA